MLVVILILAIANTLCNIFFGAILCKVMLDVNKKIKVNKAKK